MKGKILGSRYQVIEYIAEGGFGRTYLAQDTQLPNLDLCVVKQLAPSFEAPNLLEIARRLFKTEAAALYNLGHHPQIPQLLAYFEEAGKFYLVQQYIRGLTLDKELAASHIWSNAQAIELLVDCLNILQFIHEQGVIHRDLKPANLIRRQGDRKIVLVDFGTVKNVLQGQTSLGQLTVAVGTQGYMPIEQAKGKPRSTSDLYALGMICIQALTGVHPLNLEEDADGEIVWSHLVRIEPELENVLTKMTRCKARDRYQSAKLVLDDLNSCRDTVVTLPHTASANTKIINPVQSEYLPIQTPSEQSASSSDPDAIPGIRSVAIITPSYQKAKAKFPKQILKQRWWQIALGIIILTSGVYLTLQASVFNSDDSPSNTDVLSE